MTTITVKDAQMGAEKNPYQPMDGLTAIDPKSKFWNRADEHPILPVIHPTGEKVEAGEYRAVIVWQYKESEDDYWSTENANAYKVHPDFEHYTNYAKGLGDYETQQAWQIIPEPAQVEKQCAKNAHCSVLSIEERSILLKEYVKMEDVERVIEDFKRIQNQYRNAKEDTKGAGIYYAFAHCIDALNKLK